MAQTQGTLAGKEQELGLKGASALTQAGAANQAYEQAKLDYPITNAINSLKFLTGLQVPTTRTTVGPGTAGQYSQAPFNQVVGISSLLGSTLAGSNQGTAGNLNALAGYVKNLLTPTTSASNILNSLTSGAITPSQYNALMGYPEGYTP